VPPLAIRATQEVGIDISGHTSKGVKPVLGDVWHYVMTVCDHANEYCPIFPFPSQLLRWRFPDPLPATSTEEERLQAFRQMRDELSLKIRGWLAEQKEQDRVSS
jgi:arsenate reductase (thioredoxin)